MIVDDHLVITAELEGMRRLARLDRPKVGVVQEDLPGASCIWNQRPGGSEHSAHRDLVRLRPGSGVPLRATLEAVHASKVRRPGGHLEIRGAASNLATEVELLSGLGGREVVTLPRALMAYTLSQNAEDHRVPDPALSIRVADDPESLAALRVVVAQAFAGASPAEAAAADVDADFFHAPGVMTYLAVHAGGSVISTGSILIVGEAANVWSVATTPAARGQGAATAIMHAICREAQRRGAEVAALRTTDELARPGGLYDRVGFRRVGHERIWELDDVDELRMG